MNCYFFLSFFTSLSAEAKMRTPLICFVLLICVLGMEAKSISLQKGEAINYRFDLFTPKQVPSIVPLCWDSSIIFFVFVWKNIKPTPRNSKKQWGIWESQVSQTCFKNLADDMWIISFDVHWLKSKWPSKFKEGWVGVQGTQNLETVLGFTIKSHRLWSTWNYVWFLSAQNNKHE